MQRWVSLMCGRGRRFAALATVLLWVAGAASPALAQLPDGAGRDETVRVCAPCHEPNRVAAFRLTREGWQGTVADMKWRGAQGTDEELALIVEYLTANFLGEAAPKLNMNRATAIELESVLALLRKEAAALIAYREKSGGFKSLDDLKKVPGVDFKKVQARKDRIIF